MDKQLKRLLSIVLVITLCFGIIPGLILGVRSKAEENTGTYNNFEYKLGPADLITITRYIGNESTVSIPSYINGHEVFEIGDKAFADNNNVTTVILQNGIWGIGEYAFENCKSLRSINLPESLHLLQGDAFANCVNLTSINIPSEVEVMGHSIDNDGDYATRSTGIFKGCSNLKTIIFNDGIKKIDSNLFCDCTGLQSITIPNSVEVLGGLAFFGCINLEHVVFEKDSQLIEIGDLAFERCYKLNSISIPDSVESIGDRAFSKCKSLDKLVLPNNLKSLGYEVISESGISKITIPNTLKTADMPFSSSINEWDDRPVLHITLESGITVIPDSAFYDSRIESIELPESVTEIGDEAFDFCYDLTAIYIPKTVNKIGERNFTYSDLTIYGVSGSYAEKYAKENSIKFVSGRIPHSYSENWDWGVDNYSFFNDLSSFSSRYYLTPEDHKLLLSSLINPINLFIIGGSFGNLDKQLEGKYKDPYDFRYIINRNKNFLKNDLKPFNGACYGMSLSAASFKAGVLNTEAFGAAYTHDLQNNSKVESLNNLYQMTQYDNKEFFFLTSEDDSDERFNMIVSNLCLNALNRSKNKDKMHPILLCFTNHSVICFGAEEGSFKYKNNNYNIRLLIADPCFDETSYLYINDVTSGRYKYVYSKNNDFKFEGFSTEIPDLNGAGSVNYAKHYNKILTYGQNMMIKGAKGQVSIIGDKVKKSAGELSLIVNHIANQTLGEDDQQSDYFYLAEDSSKNYTITPLDENGNNLTSSDSISALVGFSDSMVGLNGVGTGASLSDNGGVSIEDAQGEVTIIIDKKDNPFDLVSITGNADGDIDVTLDDNELLISGELADYTISNMNLEAETYSLSVNGNKDSKVEVEERGLLAHIDTDNDGTYDTVIDNFHSDVTGLVQGQDGKWAMYKDGKVDTSATGVFKNKFGWWRVEKGYVNFDAQGIYKNQYGWWKTTDGKVTFKETGVFKNDYGWWRVKDSKVDFDAQGIYRNQNGWWKTTKGKVTFKENGVFKNENGWWKVKDSKVDFNFTGIASNKYGSWYIQKGKVDFNKNGKVKYNNKTYTIKNGKVV